MSSSLLANVVQQFSQPQDQPVQQSKSDLLLNAAAFAGTEALLKNHEEENNEKPRFWRDAGLAGAIAYGIYKYKDHQANKQQQQQLQWQQQQQYMQQLQQQQQQQQQAAQYQQQIVQRQQIYSQYSPYYNYTQPYNVQYAYQRPHYYPQQYLTAPHTYGHIQQPHSQYTYQTPYYQYNYPQQSTPGYFDRLGGQQYYQPYTPYGQPATFGQPPTFIQPQTYGQPAAYIQPGYRYPYY